MISNPRTRIGSVIAGLLVAVVVSACGVEAQAPSNDIGREPVPSVESSEGVDGVGGVSRCAVSPLEARAEKRNVCAE